MSWFIAGVLALLVVGFYFYTQKQLKLIHHKDILMERASQALEEANQSLITMRGDLAEQSRLAQDLQLSLDFQIRQYEKLASQKKSSEVRTGKIVEQLSPFLENYPLSPDTACFLGQPIDFIHFDEDKITFVEVKSGKSQLSKKQRAIKSLIDEGKVEFIIYRIEGEDGSD